MPLYDFKCDRCGYVVALIIQNWRDATDPNKPMTHEECGGNLVRQPSAPGFVITGFNAGNGYSGKR